MEGICKWCGSLWSEHDREQLARECYPKQIANWRAALEEIANDPTVSIAQAEIAKLALNGDYKPFS